MELTEKEIQQIREGQLAWDNHQRKEAIKQLFVKDSIAYELEDFGFIKRKFLWLKTLICLLLKRTNASYLDKNYFCILAYNETADMCGSSWEACWISGDIFSGWNVCVGSDGT